MGGKRERHLSLSPLPSANNTPQFSGDWGQSRHNKSVFIGCPNIPRWDLCLLIGCPQGSNVQSVLPFGIPSSYDMTSACHRLPLTLRSRLTLPLIAPQESPNLVVDEAMASTKMFSDFLQAASKIPGLPPLPFPLAALGLCSLFPEGKLSGPSTLSRGAMRP